MWRILEKLRLNRRSRDASILVVHAPFFTRNSQHRPFMNLQTLLNKVSPLAVIVASLILSGCGGTETATGTGWQEVGHGISVRRVSSVNIRGTGLRIVPIVSNQAIPRAQDDQEKLAMVQATVPQRFGNEMVARGIFMPSGDQTSKLVTRLDKFDPGSATTRALVGFGAGFPQLGISGALVAPNGTTVLEFRGHRGFEPRPFQYSGSSILRNNIEDFARDLAEVVDANLPR